MKIMFWVLLLMFLTWKHLKIMVLDCVVKLKIPGFEMRFQSLCGSEAV